MKCLVPSQNVKIIARAVNSLAKIGDEVFIECSDDGMTFRTVNTAQSAFAEYRMFRSFFSTYVFDHDDEQEAGCKVTMKSFLSVFKNPHCADKQVESCGIKMKPTGNVIVFQIKYSNSYVRKYYLPILENERLEATVPEDAENGFTVSSKFLSSAMKNFRYSEDEVTLIVEKEKTIFKNHLELKRDEHFMRTELCFHPTEFESYSITMATSVTFCFKELRAVLALAEPSGLPITTMFSSPGRPMLFKVANHPAYEANYVVSTLNSTNANLDSSLVGSQRTSIGSQRTSRMAHRGSEPIENDSEPIQNNQVERRNSVHERSHLREQPSTSNGVGNMSMGAPAEPLQDVEMREIPAPSSIPCDDFPSKITGTPDSSVMSAYGSNSEIFNNASPATMSPHPTFPSIPEDGPSNVSVNSKNENSRLMKLVFARCYDNTNLLDRNPKHKIILSPDSDPEQI